MRVVVLLVLFGWGSVPSNAWSLDAEQWFVEGNRFSSAGKFEEAVRAYQKSIDQNAMAPVAYYNLGIAYKIYGNWIRRRLCWKKQWAWHHPI